MAIVRGAGQIFAGAVGGEDFTSAGRIGGFDGELVIKLPSGEHCIPPDTVKKFTAGLLDVTGTFSGQLTGNYGCYFGEEDAGPDKDGWESRINWERN